MITSVVFYWLHILEPILEHEGQPCKNVNARRQGSLGTILQAGFAGFRKVADSMIEQGVM